MSDLRLNAYYYRFSSTGVHEIDAILCAVACAGKAFHLTEDWTNPISQPYHEALRGESPVDWIQNAADDAAGKVNAVKASEDRARENWSMACEQLNAAEQRAHDQLDRAKMINQGRHDLKNQNTSLNAELDEMTCQLADANCRMAELEKQLSEARDFAEDACENYNQLLQNNRILTCAYCGQEYPPNTPPTQHEALSAHIAVCEKHPMRIAEIRIANLEHALRPFAESCKRADKSSDDVINPPRTLPVDSPGKMCVRLEAFPRCMWHSSCVQGRGSGFMREIECLGDHSILKCMHCGKKCRVSVGASWGDYEFEEVPESEAPHAD